MEKLVYAEPTKGITFEMLEDKNLLIISDTGLFIVTTEENSQRYEEDFYPVGVEAINEYEIVRQNGRLVSRLFPRNHD